jgi:stage III sporulation protein AC
MNLNIDIIFKIASIGLLITVVIQVLKKSDRDDIAMLVSIVGTVIVLSLVVNVVNELFQSIKDIFYLY